MASFIHLDEGPNPDTNLSEKSYSGPNRIEELDPDPHHSEKPDLDQVDAELKL